MKMKNAMILVLGTAMMISPAAEFCEMPIAEASFEVPTSASQQERMAHHEMKTQGAYDTNQLTPEQRTRYNQLLSIEQRLAKANDIEMTDQPFTKADDHKTKIHPLRLCKGDGWSYSAGAGYILISDVGWKFSSLKGKAETTQTIAHEMGHSLYNGSNLRAGLFIALRRKHENRLEETRADRRSVELIGSLPEGGWGYYLLGNNRFNSQHNKSSDTRVYYHAWKAVCSDIEKATKDRIDISVKDHYGISYVADKIKYPIAADCTAQGDDYSDYLGGQIAECIVKDAFRPENLHVVPTSSLPSACGFPSKNVLICSSPRLPYGWRALAFLHGDKLGTYQRTLFDRLQNNGSPRNLKEYQDVISKLRQGSYASEDGDAAYRLSLLQIDEIAYLAKLEAQRARK